jgi:hypothetical protein
LAKIQTQLDSLSGKYFTWEVPDMNDLLESILIAYPSAIENQDFYIVTRDGVMYIDRWNTAKLGEKPNEADLIEAQASAVVAAARAILLSQAWAECDAYIESHGLDKNNKVIYLDWKYDPDVNSSAKSKIADIKGWSDLVWGRYMGMRDDILNGTVTTWTFNDLGSAPFTFAQVLAAKMGG